MSGSHDITNLLHDWSKGDKAALNSLVPLIYNQLRAIAHNRLEQERPEHSLQVSALVNEAYMRLINWQAMEWQSRAHFFGVAAQIMRNILVDHARKYQAEKRGGDQFRVSLAAVPHLAQERDLNLIALDDALSELATIDQVQSRIIELRYFGGLTVEETAEVLGLSTATVNREWKMAKMWLLRELDKTQP